MRSFLFVVPHQRRLGIVPSKRRSSLLQYRLRPSGFFDKRRHRKVLFLFSWRLYVGGFPAGISYFMSREDEDSSSCCSCGYSLRRCFFRHGILGSFFDELLSHRPSLHTFRSCKVPRGPRWFCSLPFPSNSSVFTLRFRPRRAFRIPVEEAGLFSDSPGEVTLLSPGNFVNGLELCSGERPVLSILLPLSHPDVSCTIVTGQPTKLRDCVLHALLLTAHWGGAPCGLPVSRPHFVLGT